LSYKKVNTTVFALESGGGNPCPVILHADQLKTDEMQKLAKDFGHETAFVLKPTRSDCDVKFRFFVPLHEMEMCIHATIGSITVLIKQGMINHSPVIVETILGPIKVEWTSRETIDVSVEQFLPEFKDVNLTKEEISNALHIEIEQIGDTPIQSVSTSRHKLIIPLKNVEILNQLKPDFETLWKLCDDVGTSGFYPFGIDENGNVQARQFPKRAGYNEDPATGVAASALGAYLAAHQVFGHSGDGWQSYRVIQGVAMGRPSVIRSEVFVEDNEIRRTRIKGSAIVDS
jgi:PhzF family phenazine biosynthesis protein